MNIDLLLLVLVIQYQLADKAAAMAAYREWSETKPIEFQDFLVQRGILLESDKQLLMPMFKALVAKNQGDAQMCLSALSSIDSAVLENLGDAAAPEVTNPWTFRTLSGSGESSESTARDSTSRLSKSGEPRFRVLRPHAKGGLGEVSIATDIELNREVAFKEIQDRFVHDENSRARFLLEAEVTGRLEHPGIVPVYGLGTYADGRPFYAMRFIQGGSLKDAIVKFHSQVEPRLAGSERRLVERQLLRRFVDVCYAVDFAHSRGVLHRDIKPGNIMLGKYGETLVVDWGLAKLMGVTNTLDKAPQISLSSKSNSAPTHVGVAVGTPAYMPPEQASGQHELLGPASDTYSLGATLYHILTGHAPFEGSDVVSVLKSVIAGSFPSPRSWNKDVPKSLESICIKAMAREPKMRYANVRELAEDVERFLADEPVSSMKESAISKVLRWIRKHPTAAATVVTGITVASFGLIAFSSILSSKNQQLIVVNRQLDTRNQELKSSLARESDATQSALASEKIAKEQGQLALSTLQGVVADIQSAVKDMPGSSKIRRRLLNTSLEQLQRVASDYVARSAIDQSTWSALQELGVIVLEFGNEQIPAVKSDSATPKGSTSALLLARSLFDRCLVIAKELEATDENQGRAKLRIADTLSQLAMVDERSGDVPKGIQALQEAVRLQESSELLTVPKEQCHFLFNLNSLGRLHLQMGDTQQALVQLETARTKALAWMNEEKSPDLVEGLALSLESLGFHWTLTREFEKAREVTEEALQLRDSLLKDSPDDKFANHGMANLLDTLGGVYGELKRHEDALAKYERAYSIREKLFRDDSESVVYARAMLATIDRLGDAFLDIGSGELALYWYEQGRDQRRVMLKQDPENTRMERELALSLERMGIANRALGKTPEAQTNLLESLSMRLELLEQNSDSALALRDVMIAHSQLSNTYIDQENYVKASESMENAQAVAKIMIDKQMNVKRSQFEYDQITAALEEIKKKLE